MIANACYVVERKCEPFLAPTDIRIAPVKTWCRGMQRYSAESPVGIERRDVSTVIHGMRANGRLMKMCWLRKLADIISYIHVFKLLNPEGFVQRRCNPSAKILSCIGLSLRLPVIANPIGRLNAAYKCPLGRAFAIM